MERLSKRVKSIPITISLIILVAIFILLANSLATFTINYFTKIEQGIYEKYDALSIKSQKTEDGIFYTTEFSIDNLSKEDLSKYNFIKFVYKYCYLFWYSISIVICAIVFYYLKLRKPIKQLNYAMDKIANNEIDFELVYDSEDELGRLCSSYERMRSSLFDNNKKMWRMIEDKKTLNKAISHDIRTPITIIKGNTEMLLKYIPAKIIDEEKTIQMLESMNHNIERLEEFLFNMSKIGKIEDIEPKYKKVNVEKLISTIKENSTLLCNTNKIDLLFHIDVKKDNIIVDDNIIYEVFNNILNNAIRYAKSKITVNVELEQKQLIFEVIDDGKGFSDKAIKEATHLYFKDSHDKEHFGLGLYLSKLLCEKHNGNIKLSNIKNGGAKVKFTFVCESLKS